MTLEVAPENWVAVCARLQDEAGLGFDTAVDLCGMDYSAYRDGAHEGPRFAVVAPCCR